MLTLTAVSLTVSLAAEQPPQPAATAAPPQEPSIELPAELKRVLTDYEKAWTARDAKALAALFTEDGFVLTNGQPMARGRAAIEARLIVSDMDNGNSRR